MKLLLFFCLFSTLAFGQNHLPMVKADDTVRIGILHFDPNLNNLTGFDQCMEETSWDDKLFQTIDTLIRRAVREYNQALIRNPKYHLSDTIDFGKYSRQYMFARAKNKDRLLWVNCFCTSTGKSTWPNPVIVPEGGKCYFNLRVNLSSKHYGEIVRNLK